MTAEAVGRAKASLEALGYVVIKAKSYRHTQERLRVSEALRKCEKEYRLSTQAWGERVCDDERRARDRVVFVYGVARAHGATVEELSGKA
jgi:hypothetical protein